MAETFVSLSRDADETNFDYTGFVVNTFISVTIAFDGTEIIVDHHEDGFEPIEGTSTQSTTEIWGDGDCTNGFRGDYLSISDCESNGGDFLNAGDAVVINSEVTLPRDGTIKYDGGDKILASGPIKVVRGGYSDAYNIYMAGAVEIYESSLWKTNFTVPVGQDTLMLSLDATNRAFERVELHVMAKEDGTVITYTGGTAMLDEGESIRISGVNEGDEVTTNKPVQVDLLAGDPGLTGSSGYYELRWYALLATQDW